MRAGIAIFAKTPGLSPLKTRLAEEIGKEDAIAFYELSVACTGELARQLSESGVQCHWALAEKEAPALERWRGLPAFWTGEGGLGKRLANVSRALFDRGFAPVGVLGTDSPQLAVHQVKAAVQASIAHDVAIIPAMDGGFVFLASSRPIESEVWEEVNYSRPDTLDQLEKALASRGHSAVRMSFEQDVDLVEDLCTLRQRLARSSEVTLAQEELSEWLEDKGF